jgi:hypothetical protein
VLAPTLDGKKLPKSLKSLPGAKPVKADDWQKITKSSAQRRPLPTFPRPIAPARIVAAPRVTTPRWVRYPLEFQMAGIGLGTLAVNKDRYNRIDRYSLFAMHGNPTAIVVPRRLHPLEPPEANTTGGTEDAPMTLTVQQQPPEYSPRFANSQNGGVPSWASACIVDLDENHVQWLYNRGTYAMGLSLTDWVMSMEL